MTIFLCCRHCPSQQRLRVFRRNWNCAESASQDSPTSYGGGVQPEVQASKLRTLASRRLPPCRAHVLLQPRAAGVQFARGKVYSTRAITDAVTRSSFTTTETSELLSNSNLKPEKREKRGRRQGLFGKASFVGLVKRESHSLGDIATLQQHDIVEEVRGKSSSFVLERCVHF